MKKSILIGALAALMLFAFVACDGNSSVGMGNSVVTKIEVTSDAPSIFVGDSVEESSLKVVGTYLDGTTFTVPESDFTFTPESSYADVNSGEETDIGSVQYTGFSYGFNNVDLVADVKGYVYSVDKLVVEGPATPESYYFIDKDTCTTDFNAGNYVVTAQALDDEDNVLFSRELVYVADDDPDTLFKEASDSEYKVSITVTGDKVPGAGTLTFARNSKFTAVGGSNTAAAVEEPIACQLDTVKSISLSAKEGYEFFAGAAIENIVASEAFEGKEIYQSGYEKDLTISAVIFDAATQAAKKLPSAGSLVTVTTTSGTLTASATFTTIANYITGFEATYTGTVEPGDSLVRENVTIDPEKIVWKNTTVGAPEGFKPAFALSRNDMPSTVATNGSWTYVVTLTNAEAAKEAPIAYMTVSAGTTTTPADEA